MGIIHQSTCTPPVSVGDPGSSVVQVVLPLIHAGSTVTISGNRHSSEPSLNACPQSDELSEPAYYLPSPANIAGLASSQAYMESMTTKLGSARGRRFSTGAYATLQASKILARANARLKHRRNSTTGINLGVAPNPPIHGRGRAGRTRRSMQKQSDDDATPPHAPIHRGRVLRVRVSDSLTATLDTAEMSAKYHRRSSFGAAAAGSAQAREAMAEEAIESIGSQVVDPIEKASVVLARDKRRERGRTCIAVKKEQQLLLQLRDRTDRAIAHLMTVIVLARVQHLLATVVRRTRHNRSCLANRESGVRCGCAVHDVLSSSPRFLTTHCLLLLRPLSSIYYILFLSLPP